MAVEITKHLFDVSEYHRLAEAGIFREDDRVELIRGEVVEMSPIGSRHAACVRGLEELLHEALGRSAHVSVQSPVQIDELSEPQPDLAVLKRRADRYATAHPNPFDVLLIIEVADTSIDYDRKVKLPLYATAGIAEAWLIDLNQDIIETFAEALNGEFQSHRRLKRGDSITSQIVASLKLSVDDILG